MLCSLRRLRLLLSNDRTKPKNRERIILPWFDKKQNVQNLPYYERLYSDFRTPIMQERRTPKDVTCFHLQHQFSMSIRTVTGHQNRLNKKKLFEHTLLSRSYNLILCAYVPKPSY